MTTSPQWARIPQELRSLNRWCVAGPDKAPYYLPNPSAPLAHASVTDARTWMTFDAAASAAVACGQGIGFICQDDDPFTCIDIDYKDTASDPDKPQVWTTPEQVERGWAIVRKFESYTEYSRRGDATHPRLHIWVGGKIGQGARRENIEVYSQKRFIICTGNVLVESGVVNRQALLDVLIAEIRAAQGSTRATLVEEEEQAEDKELIERAMHASNGDKFDELCRGDWERMGFPSQSEADLALMSMFTFYSASNAQCRRLFRMSALGKRTKAQKDDRYLNLTLQLIRGRQAREQVLDQASIERGRALAARLSAQPVGQAALNGAGAPAAGAAPGVPAPPHAHPTPAGIGVPGVVPPPPTHQEHNGHINGGELYSEPGMEWPPGFAGELARFIYHSSPRPVREVSIVATLGLLAGICGRAYTVPQSGLNMYVILVARSAIGKEAMHSGISLLLKTALESIPQAIHFVDFNDFASGQALVKKCAETQSFVNVAGEWGRKLKRLSVEDGKEGPMQALRTAMTNLYQKSGPASIVGGLAYSNKENNVSSVSGVAYSMIGETTPDTFYDSLTESMMSDGFLSRFTVIEYSGDRPPTNHKQVMHLDTHRRDHFCSIIKQAVGLNQHGQHCAVQRTEDAGAMLVSFDDECDAQIRSTKDESWRQMWNRAHLKVLRIAALLAVADNYGQPLITKEHVQWALMVVRGDIAMMSSKIKSGDIGQDDTSRERKLLDVTRSYFSKPLSDGYGIPSAMKEAGIIPRKYLQLRTQRLSSFTSFRNGAIAALDSGIKSLCDSGYYMEVHKDKIAEAFGFHGKCYRVLDAGDTPRQ